LRAGPPRRMEIWSLADGKSLGQHPVDPVGRTIAGRYLLVWGVDPMTQMSGFGGGRGVIDMMTGQLTLEPRNPFPIGLDPGGRRLAQVEPGPGDLSLKVLDPLDPASTWKAVRQDLDVDHGVKRSLASSSGVLSNFSGDGRRLITFDQASDRASVW